MSDPRSLGLLDDGHAFPDGLPSLYDYVIGDAGKDELSYEEWVHPLRMTGGKLALKWEHRDLDHYGYVWWEPQGLVYTFETAGTRRDGFDAMCCFRETMIADEKITVVLKEDMDA